MTPLEANTVPTRGAPPSNNNGGERHGRPFTLRLEGHQEDRLRRELARLELLPFDERPPELFGWDAGGGVGRRRASLGWFLVWAALQHCDAQASAGKTRAPGKTRTRRKARRAGRKPAKKAARSKKGGRR